MTQVEVARLLTIMASAWPQFEPSEDKVLLWHEMMQDVDYQVAQAALKVLIARKTFPPSIAEFRQEVLAISTPAEDQITPAEAWGMVVHAIREYGSYREREALESLPPAVRKTVEYIGWREICLSEEPDVIRAQFMRMFQQVSERRQKEAVLPATLREQIAALAAGMDMGRAVGTGKPMLRLIPGEGGRHNEEA